jgi:hypothetical protein
MIRKIEYLNKRRIIYRKSPETDKPDEETEYYYLYKEGTYQCYELFRSKAKITTYKSLKWHLLVLWYLNPRMKPDEFEEISNFISDGDNGFVSFRVSSSLLKDIVYEVSMYDLEHPPKNKLRKLIFKDNTGLTTIEKLRIVGSVIGRAKKVDEFDLYDTMLYIHDQGQKITNKRLSEVLGVTERTIYRTITIELNKEKELLNKDLKK